MEHFAIGSIVTIHGSPKEVFARILDVLAISKTEVRYKVHIFGDPGEPVWIPMGVLSPTVGENYHPVDLKWGFNKIYYTPMVHMITINKVLTNSANLYNIAFWCPCPEYAHIAFKTKNLIARDEYEFSLQVNVTSMLTVATLVIDTACRLEKDSVSLRVHTGMAHCAPSDRFNVLEGIKVSMRQALLIGDRHAAWNMDGEWRDVRHSLWQIVRVLLSKLATDGISGTIWPK